MALECPHGRKELWIVDLNELTIEVYRVPSPGGYQDVRILQKGQSLAFQAFPAAVFTVEQLLVGFL
ncbi:MAG: Uma2 family endonuclease [Cyanobacteria bacterium J06641_5]